VAGVDETVADGATLSALTSKRARVSPAPSWPPPPLRAPTPLRPRNRRLQGSIILSGWALPALDFIALGAGYACAVVLTPRAGSRLVLVIFPFLGVLVMSARGAYARRLRLVVLDSLGLVAGSSSVTAMASLALLRSVPAGESATSLLVRSWLLSIGFVGVVRVGFTGWQHRRGVVGAARRRATPWRLARTLHQARRQPARTC